MSKINNFAKDFQRIHIIFKIMEKYLNDNNLLATLKKNS